MKRWILIYSFSCAALIGLVCFALWAFNDFKGLDNSWRGMAALIVGCVLVSALSIGLMAATGKAAATASDIYEHAIVPSAAGLDLKKLSYTVTWDTGNSPQRTTTVDGVMTSINNTVTVTVSYKWVPEILLSERTFTSTSVETMSY